MTAGHGVVVLVPARDEAGTIGAALRGIRRSLETARDRGLLEDAVVEVAAHRCGDSTAAVARAALDGLSGARVVADEKSPDVGTVRDRAARRGLARVHTAPGRTWVLSTDADTEVGPRWISSILDEAARTGAVAVVGLAALDAWHGHPDREPSYARLVTDRLRGRTGLHQHEHVYGANLAVRADAYLAVGGFPHVAHGEDQRLVDALAARDLRVLRTRTVTVTTSGRLEGRAEHGLAALLRGLEGRTDAPLEPTG